MNEVEWLNSDDAGSMLEFLCDRRRMLSERAQDSLTRSLDPVLFGMCRGI
jgi:hypothetical protein